MASASNVTLKLLIDTKSRKVLFAEAGKDFVDFLFNLLSLPIGTVIRLLTKNAMVGSLGNLYDSIEKLSDTYMQPNQRKDTVLNPKAPISAAHVPLLMSDNDVSLSRKLYMCSNQHFHIADDLKAVCPTCKNFMATEVPYVARVLPKEEGSSGGEGGFVKGVVTYMVMDNLVVKPMSTISSIAMLSKFNVKEVGALEEKVVELGMNEGLRLLKASLQCKNILTSVFLG